MLERLPLAPAARDRARDLAAALEKDSFHFVSAAFRPDKRGAPVCAIHALPGGERLDELALPTDILAEAQGGRAALQQRFPALFERPYISATRYLIGPTL